MVDIGGIDVGIQMGLGLGRGGHWVEQGWTKVGHIELTATLI